MPLPACAQTSPSAEDSSPGQHLLRPSALCPPCMVAFSPPPRLPCHVFPEALPKAGSHGTPRVQLPLGPTSKCCRAWPSAPLAASPWPEIVPSTGWELTYPEGRGDADTCQEVGPLRLKGEQVGNDRELGANSTVTSQGTLHSTPALCPPLQEVSEGNFKL